MVTYDAIKAANANLKSTTSGTVAVVVGGTNGIGRAFLDQLATNTESSKIYIVGRSHQVLDTIKSDLTTLNPSNTYIPILANDLTLLSSTRRATTQILSQEKSKIDLLFMSPGYLTLKGRDETTESLDKITSIRYYSRMLILLDLLPLLHKSPSPRVLTVLAGGMEGALCLDDLPLKSPSNYGVLNAANTSATFTTLGLEQLQQSNRDISFIHIYPGEVKTNLFNTEHFNFFLRMFLTYFLLPIVGFFLFITPEECGARCLYYATDPKFSSEKDTETDNAGRAKGTNGVVGSGVYTVNGKSEVVVNEKVLGPYREQGIDGKIWEHTLEEYKRILG